MSSTTPFAFSYSPTALVAATWHLSTKDCGIIVVCPRCNAHMDVSHFRFADDGRASQGLACPALPHGAPCAFSVLHWTLLDWLPAPRARKKGAA